VTVHIRQFKADPNFQTFCNHLDAKRLVKAFSIGKFCDASGIGGKCLPEILKQQKARPAASA
jgi:hypothetical protein